MAVPDYQSLMLPLLKFAEEQKGEISTGDAVEALACRFELSQAKRWDNSAVGRPEVMQFAGALPAQKATKGIAKVVSDDSRPRRFTGRVNKLYSRFEAWLRSDALNQEVKCVPAKQKFTVSVGQTVTFSLGMNYRGYLAIELRPE